MRSYLVCWIVAATFASWVVPVAAATECDFGPWRTYKGMQLYRSPDRTAYLYVTSRKSVDADGAPNAYHPDDVGKACGATGVGLDCPGNAGYSKKKTSWWPTVLAPDPAHPKKAYVQPSGATKGFFISKTALVDPTVGERDTKRYVDARNIPYLVFPRPFYHLSGTGRLGDVGAAYHLSTGKWTPFIVADIGPNEPLGEGSIAMFEGLGGHNPNPRNGAGVPQGKVLYIVFPYSAAPNPWPLTKQQIADAVKQRLDGVGGESVFEACKQP